MTNEEAKELYVRAMGHVEGSRFGEALALLDQLDAERPNSRHVTYHRARCLIELGRLDEAKDCCQKLEGKMEKDRMDELRAMLAAKQPEPKTGTQAPAPQIEGGPNVFLIESVFPVSTDQVTVTGRVKSGLFRVGDALTIVSPDGLPLLAPIVRIGTADTPLNLVRAGQQAVMLLHAEPHHVVPGSSATSEAQEESYAKTMVASTDTPISAAKELSSALLNAERLLKRGKYDEAKQAIEASIRREPNRWSAHWLLARVYLEAEAPLRDSRKALECVREAYELGGAEDAGVIYTLAQSLAANGEAGQGLRFLERFHEGKLSFETRAALAQRIHDYRVQHGLGHVWEFADQYGEVIFEASAPQDIVKAIKSGTAPRDAKCRRDHIGDWRSIEAALAPEFPEIAALFKPAAMAGGKILTAVIAVLAVAVVLAILWLALR